MNADAQRLSDCLGRLSEALTILDHGAVNDCVAELGEAQLGDEAVTATGLAVLAFQLRSASQLAESAGRLYEGWSQMASPPASAYTPEGLEPIPVRRTSMNVDG